MARGKKLGRALLSMVLLCGFGFVYVLLSSDTTTIIQQSALTLFQPQKRNSTDGDNDGSQSNQSDGSSGLGHTATVYYNQTLEGEGVISKLYAGAGIGNQLYLYACMYALAKDLKRPLYNFLPAMKQSPSPSSKHKFPGREFLLDKFQIPLDNLIDSSTQFGSSVSYVSDPQLLFRSYSGKSSFFRLGMGSYCQSYAYWIQYKDDILSMFQLKPEVIQEFPPYAKQLQDEIEKAEDSVAVHVRRGDYRKNKARQLPISYQRDSIPKIEELIKKRRGKNHKKKSSPKFFIFSDDIEYCRKEFKELAQVHQLVFVSSSSSSMNRTLHQATTSLEDFFLMTKCTHFIIPNSTFSWWAAYLSTQRGSNARKKGGRGGIVIASAQKPAFWGRVESPSFYRDVIERHVLFPKGWFIYYPS